MNVNHRMANTHSNSTPIVLSFPAFLYLATWVMTSKCERAAILMEMGSECKDLTL
jgi:hypothetical protein